MYAIADRPAPGGAGEPGRCAHPHPAGRACRGGTLRRHEPPAQDHRTGQGKGDARGDLRRAARRLGRLCRTDDRVRRTMNETVLSTLEGPIAWITLNRPERLNAMNRPLVDGLIAALSAAEANDAVRAIILH